MRVGLLVCDHINEKLHHIATDYHSMFSDFLPDLELVPYYACEGQLPENPDKEEAYICTGSSYSVYSNEDWIQQAKRFTKEAFHAQKKYVGICFGHQLIAESLGGKVEPASQGWCIGIHDFQLSRNELLPEIVERFSVLMMCQDQVVDLPEGAEVLASSDSCRHGMYMVSDHFLGIQGHPEFSKAYNQALYNLRSERIPSQKRTEADSSLERDPDKNQLSKMIHRFLKLR